jgi:hypothetical protein
MMKTIRAFLPNSNSLKYARIDGIVINGTFRIMELELIEPYFYPFHGENESAVVQRWGDVVRQCVRQHESGRNTK